MGKITNIFQDNSNSLRDKLGTEELIAPKMQSTRILEITGGTSDYNSLSNLPSIHSITLSGNKELSDFGFDDSKYLISNDLSDYYTKSESDSRYISSHLSLSDYFTKQEVSSEISNAVNSSKRMFKTATIRMLDEMTFGYDEECIMNMVWTSDTELSSEKVMLWDNYEWAYLTDMTTDDWQNNDVESWYLSVIGNDLMIFRSGYWDYAATPFDPESWVDDYMYAEISIGISACIPSKNINSTDPELTSKIYTKYGDINVDIFNTPGYDYIRRRNEINHLSSYEDNIISCKTKTGKTLVFQVLLSGYES